MVVYVGGGRGQTGAERTGVSQQSVISVEAVISERAQDPVITWSSHRPTMTKILLCQCLLLTAGLALATDSPADLVSCCSVFVGDERKSVLTGLVLVCIDCSV